MSEAILLRDHENGVETLTLNRPQQRNALSVNLMAELQAALDEIRDTAHIKVVVLAANGPAFCAGHDLREVQENTGSREFFSALFSQCARMMSSIVRLPQPVIAQVHGMATAAGCQLVASCDLAVAAKSAKFATPGVNIGLFCSTPMVALSRNVPRKMAMDMLLTGEPISAEQAQIHGLVSRVSSDDTLTSTVNALAQGIAARSPLTLKIGKEAFYKQAEMTLDAAYQFTAEVMTNNMLAHDAEEGVDAFINKRQPVWRGE